MTNGSIKARKARKAGGTISAQVGVPAQKARGPIHSEKASPAPRLPRRTPEIAKIIIPTPPPLTHYTEEEESTDDAE